MTLETWPTKRPAGALNTDGPDRSRPSTNRKTSTKEICLTNTTEPAAEHPPIFLDDPVSDPDAPSSPGPSPSRRKARPSTKGDRYETSHLEKCITRRVRRDGSGKPAYDVQVWVNGRALSRSFAALQDARRWRDEMVGARATGRAKIPVDRRITVAQFVTTGLVRLA